MAKKIDWGKEIKPLLKKYKNKKHPLDFKNIYQMMIMVILAAQDSDKNINNVAPDLFKEYPNLEALANASEGSLQPLIKKVRNNRNKTKWLLSLAQQLKKNKNIPSTMEELIKLPGIGRKTANVLMREMGVPAEGVAVDLHVVRVAPRLGIANGTDPKKIEQQIMEAIPQKYWSETGMAISFLGRETCRPTNPHHAECVMNKVCDYYMSLKKKPKTKIKSAKIN